MIYIILSLSKFRLFGLSNLWYLFAYVFHAFKKLYDTLVLCFLLSYYVCWMSRLIIVGNNTAGWTFTKMTARSEVRNIDTNAERYIRLFDISKRDNVHFFLREKNRLDHRPFNFLESDPCHTRKFLSLCHRIFMNFFTSYLHRIYIVFAFSKEILSISFNCILFKIFKHFKLYKLFVFYSLFTNKYRNALEKLTSDGSTVIHIVISHDLEN